MTNVRIIARLDVKGPKVIKGIHLEGLRVVGGGSGNNWANSPLEDACPGRSTAYFLHSFAGIPDDPQDNFAECDYAGHRLCAAVRRDNIFGVQFHPEKSAEVGLNLLRRFQQ